jgi:hypothetical protein
VNKIKLLRWFAAFNLRPLTYHLFGDDLMKRGRPAKLREKGIGRRDE